MPESAERREIGAISAEPVPISSGKHRLPPTPTPEIGGLRGAGIVP